MAAEKLVMLAVTLLLGGFVLVTIANTLVEANPSFNLVATAIIGAFIAGAAAMLRRGR